MKYIIAALLTNVSKVLDDSEAKKLDLTNLSHMTRKDKRLKLLLGTDERGNYSLSLN